MESHNHIDQPCQGRIYRAVCETLEGRTFLSTYTVTNTNDSGAGSLRQAITDANAHAGADTVRFAIGSGAKTIYPSKALPGVGDGTTIDGTSQPGFAGKPLITLSGNNAGGVDGLKITGSGCTIRGLVINNFKACGILVMGAGSNKIAGCYIGTTSSGLGAAPNGGSGILLQSPNNTVGGSSAADRNVLSANKSAGVMAYTGVARNNTITGNFLGCDANGSAKLGNLNGVHIDGASGNTINFNTISGNGRDGVLLIKAGASGNKVQNNYIGLNAAGTARLGNGWYGVETSQSNNVIGGVNKGNVVSANGYGGVVCYLSSSYGNLIQGNFIGTDKSGTKDLGNIGRGLEFTNGAHDNRAGGKNNGEGNIISGNDKGGVGIYSGSKGNLLQRNNIGTAVNGAALPNTGHGVIVTDNGGLNYIGGTGVGNVIAYNTDWGVWVTKGLKTTVAANAIHHNAKGAIFN